MHIKLGSFKHCIRKQCVFLRNTVQTGTMPKATSYTDIVH